MDKQNLLLVAYRLFTSAEGETPELVEEATEAEPFRFISGMGMALELFEETVANLENGATFDFEIPMDKAFGPRDEEAVVELDKNNFCVDGHFDRDNIFEGNIIPLMNPDGEMFYARVISVGDEKVKLDLNHPFAGKDLRFTGKVLENRAATNDELAAFARMLSSEGCGCGCEHDHEHHEHGEHCCHHHDHEHGEHGEHCCHHHDHEHGEHGEHCCHHDHEHGEHGHCHCHEHEDEEK